jgi:hypothetical protein
MGNVHPDFGGGKIVQSKLLLGENELFWLERFHRNGSFRMLN